MTIMNYKDLHPPSLLLLGAGPSNIDPRILGASISPIVGHLDPFFMEIMEETVELLRYVFKTKNRLTLPISGTGSAGMESAICNVVEKGDEVITCVQGFFGERAKKMVQRCGGIPITVKSELGGVVDKEEVEDSLSESNAKIVTIVHTETSTGVVQSLKEIAQITKQYDAFLVVDAVASLGGDRLNVDKTGIDICYGASQKCLSCPPGLAPITVNEKVMEHIRNRKTKVQSWYFDLSTIETYWLEQNRAYHHTAPISLIYALREGLRIILEEGIEKRWDRHRKNWKTLVTGLENLGLEMFVSKERRSPVITSIKVPQNIVDLKVRRILRDKYGISVSGGLGILKGKLWRIGLMGSNSTERNVKLVLTTLSEILKHEGYVYK
jgi:alanine-glyoxylate transaminase/serine-glyoxylate transaminase/serine-pyruvate transaminase